MDEQTTAAGDSPPQRLSNNPRDPAFWSVGCRRLERLGDQFEQLD